MELSATSNVSQGSHGSIYPALFSHSGGGICAIYTGGKRDYGLMGKAWPGCLLLQVSQQL